MVSKMKLKITLSIIFLSVLLFCLFNLSDYSESDRLNIHNFVAKELESTSLLEHTQSLISFRNNENVKSYGLIGVDENNEFGVFSMSLGNKTTYFLKDLVNGREQEIVSIDASSYTLLKSYYNDKVVLITSEMVDNDFVTNLTTINSKGEKNINILATSSKLPYVSWCGDRLIVNYEDHDGNIITSLLKVYDYKTMEYHLIDKQEYNIVNDTVSGKLLLFAGGNSDYLYYQIITYENENLINGGKVNLIQTDSHLKKIRCITLDKKMLFVGGGENYFLTSDYLFEPPFSNTGKLYRINRNISTYSVLPNVSAGSDLLGFFELGSNQIITYTQERFYVIDMDSNKIQSEVYNSGNSTRVVQTTVGFAYMVFSEGEYILHKFKIP